MATDAKQNGLIGTSGSANRVRLLDAAVQVAIRDGILAMTLDAVAKEAGVSKGGLIHHFRSKDDLIAGMLEAFRLRALGALQARMADDPNPRGRWFRALIGTVFLGDADGDRETSHPSEMARFLTAILAASANNPQLVQPVRHHLTQMLQGLVAEGPNGLRQVALWPAIYGLLLWQQLGVLAPGDPHFGSIVDELLQLAEGPVTAPAQSETDFSPGTRGRSKHAPTRQKGAGKPRGRGGKA